MSKEYVLKEVLIFLHHMSNNIGITTDEYCWRECMGLIDAIKSTFGVSLTYDEIFSPNSNLNTGKIITDQFEL